MKKISIVVAVVIMTIAYLSFGAQPVAAEDDRAKAGAGLTVYLDISVMGRKRRAAERMTKLHEEHYKKGWMVVDVDPYIENGDLQGFFITYVGRE